MKSFRERRLEAFLALVDRIEGDPVRVLDVGGRAGFWAGTPVWNSPRLRVHVINVEEGEDVRAREPDRLAANVTRGFGDARDLGSCSARDFDVIFSNSVIEHVGGLEDQRRMAREIESSGARYWVQTPNKHFPFEPHFRLPFFFLIPRSVKLFLIRHFDLGCFRREPDRERAERKLDSVRLLTRREVEELFPSGTIVEERVLGLTKSYVVHNFDVAASARAASA